MLFDLDGTLIDSKTDLARSVNLMLDDLGRARLDEETIASFVGDGVPVLVRRSLTATDPRALSPDEATHAAGVRLMRDHYSRQMFVSTRLFPDVVETLDYFHSKRKAVVTSKEVGFTRAILDRLEILDHFDCIIGGDSLPQRKPDPAPVIAALDQLKASPAGAVMVGDSENDVYAGRSAGTVTCAVSYGFRSAGQLRLVSPDVLIAGIAELRDFFE
jgi:phosphoglycolate phosphatase